MFTYLLHLKCCFTSTETVGVLGTGAQDVHLDFHWVGCDARPKRSHPQTQAKPPPPKQRIPKCWGAGHCKAAYALCNLSLSTVVGNRHKDSVHRSDCSKLLKQQTVTLRESPAPAPYSHSLRLPRTFIISMK